MAGRRTKKILVPRSENPRAQRMYVIVVGLLIWANAISVLVIVASLFFRKTLDPLGSLLITTVFICLVLGMYGILKIKPPLHYLISVAAVINIAIAPFTSFGYLQGLGSLFLLYVAVRFPIKFEYQKRLLSTERKMTNVRVTPKS